MATYGSSYDGYGAYLDEALKKRRTQQSTSQNPVSGQSGWLLNDKPIDYNPYPRYSMYGGRELDSQVVPGDWNARSNYYSSAMAGIDPGLFKGDPNNTSPVSYQNLGNINLGLRSLQQEQAGQLRQGYYSPLDSGYDAAEQAERQRAMGAYDAYAKGYMNIDMLNRQLDEMGLGGLPPDLMGAMLNSENTGIPAGMSMADAISKGYTVPTEMQRQAASGGGYGTMATGNPASTAPGGAQPAATSFTPGPYYQSNQQPFSATSPSAAGGSSMATTYPFNSSLTGIPIEIQQEVMRQRAEAQMATSNYAAQRQAGRGAIESGLQQSAQSALNSSIPGIESRLQQLGIAQSGAYPEALAKRQQEVYNQSILPQLSAYDMQTQDNLGQLPLLALGNEQALRSGGINRNYALSDSAAQMSFYDNLAQQQARQQELQSLLGLVPSAIGLMGPGMGMGGGFGGMGAGMASYGGGGGFGMGQSVSGGLLQGADGRLYPSGGAAQGYYTPGGQFVPGSSGPATMGNISWFDRMNAGRGGMGGVVGGAAGGGLGAYMGEKYLGDLLGGSKTSRQIGAGVGGAALAYLMGGGIPGAVGAGVGGGFYGPGGGALGGGAGGLMGWLG